MAYCSLITQKELNLCLKIYYIVESNPHLQALSKIRKGKISLKSTH